VQGKTTKDAAAADGRVGRGVDGPNGPYRLSVEFELPAQDGAEPGEVVAVPRDPRRRRAEDVVIVLPREQLRTSLGAFPPEGSRQELEDVLAVRRAGRPHDELVRHLRPDNRSASRQEGPESSGWRGSSKPWSGPDGGHLV